MIQNFKINSDRNKNIFNLKISLVSYFRTFEVSMPQSFEENFDLVSPR